MPVELRPELTNPKDSQAIAFVCLIDGKWEKIGYVVREALSDVHAAMKNRKVLSIKYDWIKFITDWSRMVCWHYHIQRWRLVQRGYEMLQHTLITHTTLGHFVKIVIRM